MPLHRMSHEYLDELGNSPSDQEDLRLQHNLGSKDFEFSDSW
jgi:hypothetical protein